MEKNSEFDGFGLIVDEFFTYPGSGSTMDEFAENSILDLAASPHQNFSIGFDQYASIPSPFSRSPSLSSDIMDSPITDSSVPSLLSSSQESPMEVKANKATDGHIQFQKPITKKSFRSHQEKAYAVSSDASSPESNASSDPHHESSCAKCRMTEAEARRYRLQRRREQNRASQRKFRARKEAKIREAASQVATLETYVEFLEKHNGDLEKTNARLRQRLAEVERSKEVSVSADGQTHSAMRRPLIATASTPQSSQSGQPLTGLGKPSRGNTWPHSLKPDINSLYLPLFDHELHPQLGSTTASLTPVAT